MSEAPAPSFVDLESVTLGQLNVFDTNRSQFASALAVSPEMVSTNRFSVNWQSVELGFLWTANSRSNSVIKTEGMSIMRPDMRHSLEVSSKGMDNGDIVTVFLEEYDDPASAYGRFLSDFVENAMPVDLIVQHLERNSTFGDICVIEFPSAQSHEPTTATSLRAVSGNLLFSAFGVGETNLLSATEAVFCQWATNPSSAPDSE